MEPCCAIQKPNLNPKKRKSSKNSTNKIAIPKETRNHTANRDRTKRMFFDQ